MRHASGTESKRVTIMLKIIPCSRSVELKSFGRRTALFRRYWTAVAKIDAGLRPNV
jgi:hypothetical protein